MLRSVCWSAILTLLALAPFATPARAAGVTLAVSPETLYVAPGDSFNVQIVLPVAGSPLNGWEAVLAYDTTALVFVKRTQALQEGALLKPAQCGNTFYQFNSAADSLSISDTMLCNGGFVNGPGTLLSLRFVALPGTHGSWIQFRSCHVYNDGLYVLPQVTLGGLVIAGGSLGVPPGREGGGAMGLRVLPNPAAGACRIELGTELAGRSVLVADATGRIVRHLRADGTATTWDGRTDDGRATPPGVYFARVSRPGGTATARFVRLQ